MYQEGSQPSVGSTPAYHPTATKVGKEEDAALASYEYRGFPAHLAERLGKSLSVSPVAILAKLNEYDLPYTELGREKFCMLCLALIEHGIAPGLLDLRRSSNDPKNMSDDEKDESNDRQVLDLYWLFRQRRASLIPKGADFQALFEGETFDFELASEIVSKKGLARYKADKLTLHRGLELELMKIDRADIPKYLMEFKCLDWAEGSPVRSAELWSMMTGEPITTQLKERLRNRRRWIEGSLGVPISQGKRKPGG